MNCDRAKALLLEAELAELEGRGETDLAVHLRHCLECRERARRIVAAERALGVALDGMRPRHVRSRARALADATHAANGVRQRLRSWHVGRRAWVPLALAAGIAALVLITDHEPLPLPPTRGPLDPAAQGLRVEVPAGRSAVLYETENPDVIVVWFY